MKAGAGDGYYTTLYTYHAEMHIDDNGESMYLLCSYCEGGFQFYILPYSVIDGFVYEVGFLEVSDLVENARHINENYTELVPSESHRYYEFFRYLRNYIKSKIRNAVCSEDVEDAEEDLRYL